MEFGITTFCKSSGLFGWVLLQLIQMGSSDGDDQINVDDYDGDDGEEVDEDVYQ